MHVWSTEVMRLPAVTVEVDEVFPRIVPPEHFSWH